MRILPGFSGQRADLRHLNDVVLAFKEKHSQKPSPPLTKFIIRLLGNAPHAPHAPSPTAVQRQSTRVSAMVWDSRADYGWIGTDCGVGRLLATQWKPRVWVFKSGSEGVFRPGLNWVPTAAPLCSLSCNEDRAKTIKGPNLPSLAES
ncbi:Cell division FtsZ [Gossypium australe]|uniref:Cell division FtsZ n=1 Tax=Gossypium australe TaxID=47621 RepID=A0A5B6VJS0_9ROSI|nr:Cell division FtsZ [Gossypium australe]